MTSARGFGVVSGRRGAVPRASGTRGFWFVCSAARRAAAAHPTLPLLLGGASFGNRVVCEVLRSHRAELPSRACNALLLCGFPLNPPDKAEGADQKRLAHPPAGPALFLDPSRTLPGLFPDPSPGPGEHKAAPGSPRAQKAMPTRTSQNRDPDTAKAA